MPGMYDPQNLPPGVQPLAPDDPRAYVGPIGVQPGPQLPPPQALSPEQQQMKAAADASSAAPQEGLLNRAWNGLKNEWAHPRILNAEKPAFAETGGKFVPRGAAGEMAQRGQPSGLLFPAAEKTPENQSRALTMPKNSYSMVGAQNQDLVDPQYQAKMKAALSDESHAVGSLGGAQSAAAKAKADALRAEQAQLTGDKQKYERNATGWTSEAQKELLDNRAAIKRLGDGRVHDPEQEMTTADHIRYGIAQILSGAMQGWFGNSGPNNAVTAHQADVAHKIAVQKANLDQQRAQIDDLEKLHANTMQLVASKRADEQQQAAMGVDAAKLEPEVAAAEGEAPVFQAKAGIDQAQLARQAAQQDAQMHHYTPAHAVQTGPDMNKIRQHSIDLAKEARAIGVDLSPDDAMRKALAEYGVAQQGPLVGFAKGGTSPPVDTGGPLQSTAYDPRRYIQGTEAFKHVHEQEEYNAAVLTKMKAVSGYRNIDAVKELAKPFLAGTGDTEKTLAMKQAEFKRIYGKGGAAPVAEGKPTGFEEAGGDAGP